MKTTPRYTVVLNLSAHVPDLITQGRGVVLAMGNNNAWFPSPVPPLPLVSSRLDDLEKAEQVAQTKATGSVAIRDAKQGASLKDLRHLAAHVQIVVDSNPGSEEVIIKSANMDVKKKTPRKKAVFSAKHGEVSGSVQLQAPFAGGRASHYWQSSTDQKAWTDYPETIRASTEIHNLSPGTVYAFRHRVLTPSGLSDWDQIITLMAM